jgi:Endo-alpha-N-acetylgalactosaminidase
MNRRDLITGAAGLAASGMLSVRGRPMRSSDGSLAESPLPSRALQRVRRFPANPITLRNEELEVVFDPRHGLPYAYRFQDQRVWGENSGEPARAIVCRMQPRIYRTLPLEVSSMQRTGHLLNFQIRADFSGRPAVVLQLRYALEGRSLLVTMESVKEHAGFEFIELALPRLMTVREEDGPAWMAEGRHGGSFVKLEDAKAYRFLDDDYFGRISTELPIGMVGQSGIGCVMEVTAYMDGTETEISGEAGQRYATLGCIQTYRVHGGRCYNMNDGGPPVCGNAHTPNLLVEQMPKTRFDFFVCKDQAQPWMTGAKILRARIPASPTEYFSDRFLYIIGGKNKTAAKPRTTFAESRTLVRDIALLTDGAPQTAFISGWVYDGQDTGFPSEDKVNSSLGSYEDLRDLIEAGKALNANVTLNVNYDDAYKSSPIFDEAFIARRPDGAIWKSRAWDGEDSYIVGMAEFMEGGWGGRRITYTMDRYRISNAILIDAMSWFAVRNDWNPLHPASGYKNLIAGKYKIVEQFHRGGVSVTSEQLRYPFIGKLAVTMNGPGKSHCPFGGEAVPLLPTIYRSAAIWGSNGDGSIHPQQEIFWNTRSALWFRADTDRTMIADFYYLVVVPFSKLHRLAAETYESTNSLRRLTLEQDSQVEMNPATESYGAKVNGIEIARDNATFCPLDANRIAFYSRTARQLRYPLPNGWRSGKVTARALTLTGRSAHKVQCIDGMIVVDAQPKQPVIVYAREEAIPAS